MRRLKEPRPGGGDAAPALRVEVGRKRARVVEPTGRHRAEARSVDDLGVDLALPEHGDPCALRVIIQAGEVRYGLVARRALGDLVHEVEAGADADEDALGGTGEHGAILCGSGSR